MARRNFKRPKIPRNKRNAPRPSLWVSDKSAANWYPNRVRFPEYKKRRPAFPLGFDRKYESNVQFTDPTLHRTWGGEAPIIPHPRDDLKIRLAKPMNSREYQFVNDATGTTKLPEGFIATPSGIEPLIGTPGVPDAQQGFPLDSPGEVDNDWTNDNTTAEFEFWYSEMPEQLRDDPRYPDYIPNNPNALYRVHWAAGSYQQPVSPNIRGKGFIKRKNPYTV